LILVKSMNATHLFLQEHYAELWRGAIGEAREGRVTIDPLLASRDPDQRRCITMLARPSAAIQQAVTGFLEELRAIDPEQYYYDPTELHVTVLSLFTATLEHERYLTRYGEYLAAVHAALAGVPAFWIEFTGVTLTREAVMIQGFPETTVLSDLREALRNELRTRNLTEGLDSRYVLQTAHMTVVRFRAPLRESARFAGVLERYRDHLFGRMQVQELNLVRNDWYMSRAAVEVLERYQISSNSAPQDSHPA
jgi:2'-5' RNA ligase